MADDDGKSRDIGHTTSVVPNLEMLIPQNLSATDVNPCLVYYWRKQSFEKFHDFLYNIVITFSVYRTKEK